jgi:hypothetical protein
MSAPDASRGGAWAVVAVAIAAAALVVAEGVFAGAPVGHGTVDAIGTWWFQWWVADAVTTDASLLSTDRLFFPFGKDVLAHTGANLLDALLVAPLRATFGPVVAWNTLVGAIVATNALTAGLVARRGGVWMGAVGAILGAFHPVVLHELGQGRPTQAIVAPLIGALVLGDAGLRRGGAGRLVAAGALLGLQGWFYWFSGLFGALAIGVLGAVALVHAARTGAAPRPVVGRLLVVLGVAAALAAPVAGPLALAATRGDAPGLLDVARWWTDGVVVTREGDLVRLTVLGGRGEAGLLGRAGFVPDGPVLGLVVLGLALAAPARWRVVTVLALVVALGPTVAGVPNPVYIILAMVCPPLARLWWPVRALALLVPVAVVGLAALGRRPWVASRRRAGLFATIVAAGLVLDAVGRGLLPLGTWIPEVPDGVAVLSEAPSGAAVVLPWGYDQVPLLYQAETGAPLLNGMYERTAAFVPAALRALQRDNTFLAALIRGPIDPRADAPYTDTDQAAFVALGYRWVVLRRAALGPADGPRARGAVRRLRQMLGFPRVDDAEVVVWDLTAPLAGE